MKDIQQMISFAFIRFDILFLCDTMCSCFVLISLIFYKQFHLYVYCLNTSCCVKVIIGNVSFKIAKFTRIKIID
jgi:hypothetical protein